MITVKEIEGLIEKMVQNKNKPPNENQRIVCIHAKIIQRETVAKIVIADNTGCIKIRVKHKNPLIRAGEKLSFVNIHISRKGAAITYMTTIEKLKVEEAANLNSIKPIPEKIIDSNHLFKLSFYKLIIKKLFLNIYSINAPEKCEKTKQYKQEIICHDNQNVVTIIIQGNTLINFLSKKLKGFVHCMIQDFLIVERYEHNTSVKIVENISTISLFNAEKAILNHHT